jgi:hypothetical protein
MSIQRWVSRPVEIEAVQWLGNLADMPAEWRALDLLTIDAHGVLVIRTPEGPMRARHGDYVVRGTAGEFYPVKELIFRNKYQAVPE